MAVAAAVSPSGPRAAGTHGLGLLSMAATSDQGFDVLAAHWALCEQVAAEHGQRVDRRGWRLVVPMHLAESREQAHADMAHGLLKLVRYFEKLGARDLAEVRTLDAAIEQWTERGLTLLGRAVIGTPEDAIDRIHELQRQSGGFGTILLLAHDCASPQRTRESYELFARVVLPALRDSNRNRIESLEWFSRHSQEIVGELRQAIGTTIAEYETERRTRGGGVAWGDARDLLAGEDSSAGDHPTAEEDLRK
jgi:limonene 1,2-monooxygenase